MCISYLDTKMLYFESLTMIETNLSVMSDGNFTSLMPVFGGHIGFVLISVGHTIDSYLIVFYDSRNIGIAT